ncbi:MAG TPA: hypothetical protein VGB37_14635 [Candidatus Lokiarchaeia archaeon]
MRKIISVLTIFSIIYLIGIVSAYSVTLTPSTLSENVREGETLVKVISYNIINNDNSTTSPININIGNMPTFVTSSKTFIDAVAGSSQSSGTFSIIFSPVKGNEGVYNGNIFIGTHVFSITINVEKDDSADCRLIELPHTSSFRLEQSETSSTNVIKVRTSKECPSLIFNSIAPQVQMSKPMYIQSEGESEEGKEYSFNIGLDGTDVQKGSYSNTYILSGYSGDNIYSKSIALSVTVTSGISPITNNSFSELPSCSLSSSEFQLNNTYRLICSITDLNLQIFPIIDSMYIEGKGVEETETQYIYNFKPRVTGNTKVCAKFIFKNAEIGTPFCQDIKIFQGSQPVGGTKLKFKFYPDLWNVVDNVTVRVFDNSTQQLLQEAKLYLNGLDTSNPLKLNKGQIYELRASVYGYENLVQNIEIGNKPVDFTLKEYYNIGEDLNFNLSESGVSIFLNDILISLPYKLESEGTFSLTLKKEGFSDTTKSLIVKNIYTISWATPDNEAKKGKEILIEFNSEGEYDINYTSNKGITQNIIPSEKQAIDNINSVRFKVEGYGNYEIFFNNELAKSYTIIQPIWYKRWYSITGGVILLIILFSWAFTGKKNESGNKLNLMRTG